MLSRELRRSYDQSHLWGIYLLPKGIGFILSIEMLRLWPDLDLLYSQRLLSIPHIQQHQVSWTIPIIDMSTPYPFAVLYVLSGLFMCLHPRTFFPTLVLLILHYSFFIGNSIWSYGVDYLAQTGLFFSLCFGGQQVLKLKRRHWTRLGMNLFRLQLCCIYFFAGLGKAYGPTWWNGEAIWKAMQQPFGESYLQIPLSTYRFEWLWILLGILTLLIELGYPLALIKKSFRPFIINGIILMHIGIALFMGLVHFALLMIWYNLCAWNHPFLHIAKPIIKPLENSKPKLQVPMATETINTRKGGLE